MTDLRKPVSRVSRATVHEQGRHRQIIITLEPPSVLWFRAKGCRRSYALTAEFCYQQAVKASVAAQERIKPKKGRAGGRG